MARLPSVETPRGGLSPSQPVVAPAVSGGRVCRTCRRGRRRALRRDYWPARRCQLLPATVAVLLLMCQLLPAWVDLMCQLFPARSTEEEAAKLMSTTATSSATAAARATRVRAEVRTAVMAQAPWGVRVERGVHGAGEIIGSASPRNRHV